VGVIHEELEGGSAGHSVEVAQTTGGSIADLFLGAIKVMVACVDPNQYKR